MPIPSNLGFSSSFGGPSSVATVTHARRPSLHIGLRHPHEILRGDGTHHHFCLLRLPFRRTKNDPASPMPTKSVALESDGEDELARLMAFLQSARTDDLPRTTGEYRVVPEREFDRLRDVLASLRTADGPRRFRLLQAVLSSVETSPVDLDDWTRLFDGGSETVVRAVSSCFAVGLNIVVHSQALAALVERAFSRRSGLPSTVVATNPWMVRKRVQRATAEGLGLEMIA